MSSDQGPVKYDHPHTVAKLDATRWMRATLNRSEMWVDEAIWGHRFRNDQTLWFVVLECLNIVASRGVMDKLDPEKSYQLRKRLPLRAILFHSPPERAPASMSDEAAWKAWESTLTPSDYDIESFDYLKQHFDSFNGFAQTVAFLRDTAINAADQKRWTSRFIFPHGPDCLYGDLRQKRSGKGGVTYDSDRRFFARGGEIIYLMLARSEAQATLGPTIRQTLLSPDVRWNRLVRCLLPPQEEADPSFLPIGYLPYTHLPLYDRLAEDWLALLRLGMPGADILPHLVTLTGLHLVNYLLERSRSVLLGAGESDVPRQRFVVEIAANHANRIRGLSADNFSVNQALSARALTSYIRAALSAPDLKPQWQAFIQAQDMKGVLDWLQKAPFFWNLKDDEAKQTLKSHTTVETLFEHFSKLALERHKRHVGPVHGAYANQAGLASTVGSRRRRYAPSDEFLKALIFANVPGRMAFADFLGCLYRRYGLVIGEIEAADEGLLNQADAVEFADNATRLEKRLAAMGLLQRFSDACAYVFNPFHREVHHERDVARSA